MKKNAILSEDRKYRYQLSRVWNESAGHMHFICLNPSMADENNDDPTIRRCIGFAKSHNFGGIIMTNLFAYRSTNPENLLTVDDPVGPENDYYIREANEYYSVTVIAWGTSKVIRNRDKEVLSFLQDPYCLRLTKYGKPCHPLYLPKDLEIKEYNPTNGEGK